MIVCFNILLYICMFRYEIPFSYLTYYSLNAKNAKESDQIVSDI